MGEGRTRRETGNEPGDAPPLTLKTQLEYAGAVETPRRPKPLPDPMVDGVVAAAIAIVLSWIPASLWVLFGGDFAQPLRAAGNILVWQGAPDSQLIVAGLFTHASVSICWSVLLAVVLPSRFTMLWALLAGLAIAGFDLIVLGQFAPLIADLDVAHQVVNHLAFGAIVGFVVIRRRRSRGV